MSLPEGAIAYLASVLCLLALDLLWLTTASPLIYRPLLGDRLSSEPNLAVAAGFYLLYAIGVVVFAVVPAAAANAPLLALGLGALLGLVAYGTYDLTNLATLRDWPVLVTVADLGWGVVASAGSALAGCLAVLLLHG